MVYFNKKGKIKYLYGVLTDLMDVIRVVTHQTQAVCQRYSEFFNRILLLKSRLFSEVSLLLLPLLTVKKLRQKFI